MDSVHELNEFYAWVMFYGHEALEPLRRVHKGRQFVRHGFQDRELWIPQMGVLADFSLKGEEFRDGVTFPEKDSAAWKRVRDTRQDQFRKIRDDPYQVVQALA